MGDLISSYPLQMAARPELAIFTPLVYLQFLINDGGGHFHDDTTARLPQSTLPNGGWIKFVQAIDLNGDGAQDLVTHWWMGPAGVVTKIYLNDGSGDFSPVSQTITGEATAIPNADGKGHVEFGVVVGNQLKMIADDLPQLSDIITNASQTTYKAMYGIDASSSELNTLLQFSTAQVSYAQQIKVDPVLYVYEALGLALSDGSTFQGKYAPSVIASDSAFAAQAYTEVFQHAGTQAQVQHFVDQVNFLKTIYTNSGAYGTDPAHIDLLARASVYGQLIGVAAENPGSVFI